MQRWLIIVRVVTALYVLAIAFVIVSATNNWFGPAFTSVKQIASDKLLHFALVGTLAFLVNLSLRAASLRVGPVSVQYGTLGLLVLATLEESSQLLFVNRTFDLGDLGCNIAGIVVLGALARPVAKWLS